MHLNLRQEFFSHSISKPLQTFCKKSIRQYVRMIKKSTKKFPKTDFNTLKTFKESKLKRFFSYIFIKCMENPPKFQIQKYWTEKNTKKKTPKKNTKKVPRVTPKTLRRIPGKKKGCQKC